jgi:hypothetical protein
MRLTPLTLKQRVVFGIATLFVLLLALAAAGWRGVRDNRATIEHMAQVDANTIIKVYTRPMVENTSPDIWMSLDGPVRSLIVAKHPNNNKRSALLEAAAKLPNFWHVVPAGTYRLGLSEEVFVVSHQ